MKKIFTSLLLLSGFTTLLSAQSRPADSVRRTAFPTGFAGSVTRSQPKPYKTVITEKAITRKGLFSTHKVEDKYYFEIADSVLNREILVVSRISKAGAEVRAASGYAGDQIGSSVISFEKGPGNRIFMRKISYSTYSPDSTKSMYQSVQRSNIQAIAAAFNIAAYSPDQKGSVIDITDYINGDNEVFYFSSAAAKSRIRLGSIQADRSYIANVKSFRNNVEITTVKTYSLTAPQTFGRTALPTTPTPGGGANAANGSATVELNTSLVVLPKKPMQPRFFDPRIGYFTVGYTDFDANPQGIRDIQLIKRWRLEVKPQDMAKYKRGELVEPVKPIVYYIDATTPKKWIPYLIAGVNDWQKAFEKAGFKNAIIGKMAPSAKEDSTWSIDDANHSAIVYKPSETENASGPSTADPRSGEIVESHINWYHNVQKLVHDWYMTQTAAIDPKARKMVFSDELMGNLIRFVSSHEVGHTLGLRHNFGSSSTVPVEMLRNKAFVEANGHTPSIMDYARFNYVAQPEDNISEKGIFPRIGDYDKWAIEWGYKVMPQYKTAEDQRDALSKIAIERLKNRRLFFGTESNPDDPHSQSEDLGDDAMKSSAYGIKNLQRILEKLPEWTSEKNEGYDNLENMYNQMASQFGRYIGHVSKNIGGIYENPKTVEQSGVVYEYVPAATQKEAMLFLDQQLFTTPMWMLDRKILSDIGQSPVQIVYKLQNTALDRIVTNHNLYKLISAEAANGNSAYKITDFFGDMQNMVFKELKTNQPIDVYRRNLQKMYVAKLIELLKPASAPTPNPFAQAGGGRREAPTPDPEKEDTDVLSVSKAQLRSLNALIKNALPNTSDNLSNYHLQDLSDRITLALNPKG